MSLLKELTPPIIYKIAKNLKSGNSKQTFESTLTGQELINSKGQNIKGIFMHIHKCAGTSLIHLFENYPEIISCVARPGNFPKRTGRELISDTLWNNSIKFTFVRNPYARILSAYLMFTSGPKWKEVFPTFEDFVIFLKWSDVQNHEVNKTSAIENYGKKVDNIIHHCSTFSNKKYRINEMDFVGKIENIDEDIVKIASLLNIELTDLPHRNKHKKGYSYRDYYNDRTKEIISEIYHVDLEKFGYEF